jgi:CPA2 family monovalent cation:H+ antiporter-2
MPHETALIALLAGGLGLAFVLGLLAARVGLPPLVGYLLAGIAIGPFTPGPTADTGLAAQLSEIGVILLMFGVGIHFSPRDLLAVRKIAIPGALLQIAGSTLLGALLAHWWGWSWTAGIIFGMCLAVASTVVLLRALEDQNRLHTSEGRISVGWLIIEDLFVVLVLVVLPLFATSDDPQTTGDEAGWQAIALGIGSTLLKLLGFTLVMFFAGRRLVPWILRQVIRSGSRELFTLGILAVSLGIAFGAAAIFDVSLALGAFAAGIVVGETELSQRAAEDALPLQEAFGVLFFVAVGMLFDPRVLVEDPLHVLAVLLTIQLGKSLFAFLIITLLRYPLSVALTVPAALAQVGELSFILVGLGIELQLVPMEAQNLIVAGALLSITLNPFVFRSLPAIEKLLARIPGFTRLYPPDTQPASPQGTRPHVVLVGHGRIGAPLVDALHAANVPLLVVDARREEIERLRARGIEAHYGDASRPGTLRRAGLDKASLLVISISDPLTTRMVLEAATEQAPDLPTIVRTQSESERETLAARPSTLVLLSEEELTRALVREALARTAQQEQAGVATSPHPARPH